MVVDDRGETQNGFDRIYRSILFILGRGRVICLIQTSQDTLTEGRMLKTELCHLVKCFWRLNFEGAV